MWWGSAMRLTIEFEPELWRVRFWWNAMLCRWFGHPEFAKSPRPIFFNILPYDGRPLCVRCHMPEPGSKPEPAIYEFKEGA